jgi:hypothetical protein
MVKIQYDIHELIGDLLSKDGFYVDLISCKEFTIWYLLRQLGIRSFAPIIGTVCFINEADPINLDKMLIKRNNNSNIIFKNAERFFQAKRKIYKIEDGSYKDFIKEAIHHDRFVYSLFDNLYNSLAYFHSFDNEKHGHPIVGYDDDRSMYLSLLTNQREITYNDLDKMIEDGYNQYKNYDDILYYFEKASAVTLSLEQEEQARVECLADIYNTLNDWDIELNFFRAEVDSIYQGVELAREEKERLADEKNAFYNLMMIGLHGDFVLKLRLLEQLFGIFLKDIEEEFLTNRKTASLIANMFRKASVILRRDEGYYNQTLPKIAKRVEQTYITEAKDIKDRFTERISSLR